MPKHAMNIQWETYNYGGYSFYKGLMGTYNGTSFTTSYRDYPLFMLLAKFRIWLRFKILN